jgi:hypothetical protein
MAASSSIGGDLRRATSAQVGLSISPLKAPPAPRASAIVDPRIGDLGPALLALEDGTIFEGVAFGAPVSGGGDLVVNTSQTGYQEVCTDPSYAGQVVVMTYPLIGNYGRLLADDQSVRPWLRGLVVANATAAVLEDARQLARLLRDNAIPAIAGVDTRALARHLRSNGSLRGVILEPGSLDRPAAELRAADVPRWEDQDFVAEVSPAAVTEIGLGEEGPLVAIVDYGLKANIVRSLRKRGVRVRVLPHTASPADVLSSDIAGVVFSPGPGDPARLDGPVVEVHLAHVEAAAAPQRVAHDLDLVVLRRDLDVDRVEIANRVVRPVMPEPEAARLRARRAAHDLMPETDAQQRPAVGDHGPRERDGSRQPCRVTGSG